MYLKTVLDSTPTLKKPHPVYRSTFFLLCCLRLQSNQMHLRHLSSRRNLSLISEFHCIRNNVPQEVKWSKSNGLWSRHLNYCLYFRAWLNDTYRWNMVSTQPINMCARMDTAMVQVLKAFGSIKAHCAYLFSNKRGHRRKYRSMIDSASGCVVGGWNRVNSTELRFIKVKPWSSV